MTPLLINAHLRQGDATRAGALMDQHPKPEWTREQVAIHIAAGRERDALPLLDRRLAAEPGDADAEWLLVHALYASIVHQPDAALSKRFVEAARAYVAARRANAPLVAEWLNVVAP